MAKLTDYIESSRFDSGDILIKDGLSGTRKIKVANAAVEFAQLSGVQKNADITKAEIEAKLTGTISSHGHTIPVLDSDPTNPTEGQIWLLRYIELFKDTFTGNDGDPLDADSWEVVKTKTAGSVIEHALTNDVTIQNNAMQFNLRPIESVEDGGRVGMSARMKKFQIDWTSGKRTIIWKQQPFSWASPWGMVLATTIPVEGGDLFSDYSIRVTHNNTKTLLQIKANGTLVFNQNYLHEAIGSEMYEYELAIDPDGNNITLYQGGVQKLTSPFPNFGFSKAWMCFVCRVPGATTIAPVKNIDDVIIQ